tara:strand:+ start:509 stop:664 length:156 start_codon:yes stop_codon:yes gene_type:complete
VNEIKYFSMFTGVGGFELGLERANLLRSDESNNTKRPNSNNFIKNKQLKWE